MSISRPSARLLLHSLLLVALAACGGGGGGSDAAAPAPPGTAVPLELSDYNIDPLARTVPGKGEAILALGHFAVDLASRFATPGQALTQTEPCVNGGQISISLTDRDGNGVASAGDRVSAVMNACGVIALSNTITGSLSFDLGTPTSLAGGVVAGTVSIGDGLVHDRGVTVGPTMAATLTGSFAVDSVRTELRSVLQVLSSSRDDLRIVQQGQTGTTTDAVRAIALAKTVGFDTALMEVSMAFRLDSEALVGSVEVSTPVPLRSYINRYPVSGSMEFRGARNAKIRLRTTDIPYFYYRCEYVSPTGTTQFLRELLWFESTNGFAWWDGVLPVPWVARSGFQPNFSAAYDFSARVINPTTSLTARDAVFRLQFSRPPGASMPNLFYRFQDVGGGYYVSPNWDIAATSERHGALVLIRPVEPLRHAHRYFVEASIDGVHWGKDGVSLGADIVLSDEAGHEYTLREGLLSEFTTPDTFRASIETDVDTLSAATSSLTLTAITRPADGRSVVSYRWTQLSGTPLTFSAPDSAVTTLSWGMSVPVGIETIPVQLDVVDSGGDTERTRYEIAVSDVLAGDPVLFMRSSAAIGYRQPNPGHFFNPPDEVAYHPVLSPGHSTFHFATIDRSRHWTVTLATANRAPLGTGAYENAAAAPVAGSANGLEVRDYSNVPCTAHFGRFDVLEVQNGPDGTPTRLAVDFEYRCDGTTAPPLFGSLRYNSRLAVRP